MNLPRTSWLVLCSLLAAVAVLVASAASLGLPARPAACAAPGGWWHAQVLAGLHALRPDTVIGFEMFPRQVQPVLERWVAGELTLPAFLAQTRWEEHWKLPIELYLPLFEFSRINRIPMVALNVDAKLTRAIGDKGWDAIPERERACIGRAAPAGEARRDFPFVVHDEHG